MRGAELILTALGVEADSEVMRETPRRFADGLTELVTPVAFNPTSFPSPGIDGELVVVRDIPFSSLCEHHLLPFYGTVHIGYIPNKRILGLSKLARAVSSFTRKLQVQERLTGELSDWLNGTMRPRGSGVLVEAEHLCMSIRGIRAVGSRTVTSVLRGTIRDDPIARSEFLSIARPC
jgi:GTP cyclohydrolase I